jgi:HEAT repeat protein
MPASIFDLLNAGDLQSAGKTDVVVKQTNNQQSFDDLFDFMFHKERLIALRAADALEKISGTKPVFLRTHKQALLGLLLHAENIEVKWHVALMISRVNLSKTELNQVWEKLKTWALDKNESRIVRVNALQALNDLLPQNKQLAVPELLQVMENMFSEDIPSVKARVKRLYVNLKKRKN